MIIRKRLGNGKLPLTDNDIPELTQFRRILQQICTDSVPLRIVFLLKLQLSDNPAVDFRIEILLILARLCFASQSFLHSTSSS
jgi:hypothetical protein